jgi:hypothetical protein
VELAAASPPWLATQGEARSLEFLDFRLDRAATGHDTPSAQADGDEAAVDAF